MINQNLLIVATDKQGCCVLQRLIEQGDSSQQVNIYLISGDDYRNNYR